MKPYIIAEIGSNFVSFDTACESINAAALCGADAAKFQLFSEHALYGYGSTAPNLPLEWLPELAKRAADLNIDFMCTAFSIPYLHAIDPYVKRHKVASSDVGWAELLRELNKIGKPVFISNGGHTDEEMLEAISYMHDCQVTELECTAAYPADFVDLSRIGTRGLSDHSLGISVAVHAARMGAPVIEKHFTAFPKVESPDRNHSLTADQFTRMVRIINGLHVTREDIDMRNYHNRRLTGNGWYRLKKLR